MSTSAPLSLADRRLIIAAHEAGHAVMATSLGVPLRSAEIEDVHQWFAESYIRGVVRARDEIDYTDPDAADECALIALAGPEAEAYWRHLQENVDLELAREAAYGRDDGDLIAARRYLHHGTLALPTAQARAHRLVIARRGAWMRTAAALAHRRRLTGNALRRIAA